MVLGFIIGRRAAVVNTSVGSSVVIPGTAAASVVVVLCVELVGTRTVLVGGCSG